MFRDYVVTWYWVDEQTKVCHDERTRVKAYDVSEAALSVLMQRMTATIVSVMPADGATT